MGKAAIKSVSSHDGQYETAAEKWVSNGRLPKVSCVHSSPPASKPVYVNLDWTEQLIADCEDDSAKLSEVSIKPQERGKQGESRIEYDESFYTATRVQCSGNMVIIFPTVVGCLQQPVQGDRGDIIEFSVGSARRMSKYLREAVSDYRYMVTLTYPGEYSRDGKEVKEHLRRFLQEYKRQCSRENHGDDIYSSFWFIEFQERGAPHFHIFTTMGLNKHWIAKKWYEIVGSCDKKHLSAGTRVEKLLAGKKGTIAYARKYAAKQSQKLVPTEYRNVGRFWGVSGVRRTESADLVLAGFWERNVEIAGVICALRACIKILLRAKTATYKRVNNGGLIFFIESEAQMGIIRMMINKIKRIRNSLHDLEIETNDDLFVDAELS
jgi:hypothetical protein